MNLCDKCDYLIKDCCVPYCEKDIHRDYKPITQCNKFKRGGSISNGV